MLSLTKSLSHRAAKCLALLASLWRESLLHVDGLADCLEVQVLIVPTTNLTDGLRGPAVRTEPPEQVIALDVLAGNLREQYFHLVIEAGIVGGSADDESTIAEDVAQNIGVVGLRDVVNHDVFHAGIAGSTGYMLGHALGVAIHRSIADDESGLCLIARQTVVDANHLFYIFMPHRAVRGADVVELYAGELLQRVLHGCTILTYNV